MESRQSPSLLVELKREREREGIKINAATTKSTHTHENEREKGGIICPKVVTRPWFWDPGIMKGGEGFLYQ